MSKSLKRNLNSVLSERIIHPEAHSGHDPVVKKVQEKDVSHSKDCYSCMAGTKPKRLLRVKPERRAGKKLLEGEVRQATLERGDSEEGFCSSCGAEEGALPLSFFPQEGFLCLSCENARSLS